MASKKVQEPVTVANTDIDVVEKAKDFWFRFSKPITYVSSAIIVIVAGWFIYTNFIMLPRQEKANDIIFPAEGLFDKMAQEGFNKDSINLVLNGGNGITGVIKIANTYGSTPSGNRAKLMAGACYMRLHDYNNAIKYLKDFSSTKATQVQTTVYSLLGDAYSELKNSDDALSYYKKAAEVNEKDEFMTSEALYKEGLYAETIGKTDDAIASYEKIRDNYPKSAHAADMDKYLARLGVLK
jgi:tetratricopeptide (TPR) repeat protein